MATSPSASTSTSPSASASASPFTRLKAAARRSPLVWRFYHNLKPTLNYRFKPGLKPISAETDRVLRDLNADGIAVTSVEALLGAEGVELFRLVRDEIAGHDVRDSGPIAEARVKAQNPVNGDEKAFNYSYIVGKRTLTWSDAPLRFALQSSILRLANRYFGMLTRIRYCNVWRTFATQAPARDSQLWHRDRDDHLTVKMFVYLEDVDEGAGPFQYAKGTHPKGPERREPQGKPERPGGPLRTTDEEMAAIVPRDRWHLAVGKAGTIIFADTRGYHCGGRARERDRMMFIAMFVSSSTPPPAAGHIDPGANGAPLPDDRERRFALTGQL